MNNITIKDYKEAVKSQYEIAKKNDVLGVLTDPTPAQLRDSYIRIFEKGLTRVDEEIMRAFFETKENESLKKSIENCNIGKLKPIIHFLKGIKNTENKARIELAAILVDFKNRPYHKFSKSDEVEIIGDVEEEIEKEEKEDKRKDRGEVVYVETLVEKHQDHTKSSNFNFLEWLMKDKFRFIGIMLVIMLSVFGITKYATDNKHCMEWQNNHYEIVDCETKSVGFVDVNSKIPLNENLLHLKKIKVCDTTTFFKNNKAIVWYYKNGEQLELFNAPFNPENNKPLKPITQYMIDKYLK